MGSVSLTGETLLADPIARSSGNGQDFIIAVKQVDATGAAVNAGTAASPTVVTTPGTANFATSQAATSLSPAAATQLVAARTGRRSVTITTITGTQPVYILTTNAITGLTTGDYIPATAGSSKTVPTSAAVFGTSPTAAQTVSILETF